MKWTEIGLIRMKPEICRVLLVMVLFSCLKEVHSPDPFTVTIAVGAVAVAGLSFLLKEFYTVDKCRMEECCQDERWIKQKVPGLHAEIEKNVFGQHLVREKVAAAIEGHLEYKPEKALVMSFHGPTGTGKNFVSDIIAEALYTEGTKSKYVHKISGGKHFTREEHAKNYTDSLRNWIEENATDCSRRLFIFDEIGKIPAGVLDAVKPFADNHSEEKYRQLIFIFLSNIASDQLFSIREEVWAEGRARESLKLGEIESHLYSEAYDTEGPFKDAALIKNAIIDHHIPFLPLEYVHVVKCIEDDLRKKKLFSILDNTTLRALFINDVANELQFLPKDTRMFAKSGCKKVSQKVTIIARASKYRGH